MDITIVKGKPLKTENHATGASKTEFMKHLPSIDKGHTGSPVKELIRKN
jgi:hypothetical protein